MPNARAGRAYVVRIAQDLEFIKQVLMQNGLVTGIPPEFWQAPPPVIVKVVEKRVEVPVFINAREENTSGEIHNENIGYQNEFSKETIGQIDEQDENTRSLEVALTSTRTTGTTSAPASTTPSPTEEPPTSDITNDEAPNPKQEVEDLLQRLHLAELELERVRGSLDTAEHLVETHKEEAECARRQRKELQDQMEDALQKAIDRGSQNAAVRYEEAMQELAKDTAAKTSAQYEEALQECRRHIDDLKRQLAKGRRKH